MQQVNHRKKIRCRGGLNLPYILAALLCAAACLSAPKDIFAEEYPFYVRRVIDGDTLELSNGERVRLIGIDTPEVYYSDKLLKDARGANKDIRVLQEMGRLASGFTKKLCLGRKARLEFDVERRDKYGRTLAYVYLDDGAFVNARIVEEGYAHVMTIPPNVRNADYFLKLERDARAAKKGLWAD